MKKKCLLDKPNCNKHNCEHCGWNPQEVARREKRFAYKGLTLCKDGLQRLIISPASDDPGVCGCEERGADNGQ